MLTAPFVFKWPPTHFWRCQPETLGRRVLYLDLSGKNYLPQSHREHRGGEIQPKSQTTSSRVKV